MTLTEELVSLSIRTEVDLGPEPNRIPITDQDVEALSEKLFRESGDTPLWVFAYGSPIWKPAFNDFGWRYRGM